MTTIRIEALPTPIRIVHIPLSIHHHPSDKTTCHQITTALRCAERLSPEFFGLNSNTVEIAVFGSEALVEDVWGELDELGRGVRGRWRGEADYARGLGVPDQEHVVASSRKEDEVVQISGVWRVFQVAEEEADVAGIDTRDPVIRKIARPLADAKVSIKYQSSAYADFLMVKEANYGEAMTIFEKQGWAVATSPPITTINTPTSSHFRPTPPPLGRTSAWRTDTITAINIVPPLTASAVGFKVPSLESLVMTSSTSAPHLGRTSGRERRFQGAHSPARAYSMFADSMLGLRTGLNDLDADIVTPAEVPLAHVMWDDCQSPIDALDVHLVPMDGIGEQETLREIFDKPRSPDRSEFEPDSLASSCVLPRASLEMLKKGSGRYRTRLGVGSLLSSEPEVFTIHPTVKGSSLAGKPSFPAKKVGGGYPITPSREETKPELRVLDSRIAVVGLNNESERKWEYRMSGFLGWPERHDRTIRIRRRDGTLSDTVCRASGHMRMDRPAYISFIRTIDGTSLATEISHLRTMFVDVEERGDLLQTGHELESWDEEEAWLVNLDDVSDGSSASFHYSSFVEGSPSDADTESIASCQSLRSPLSSTVDVKRRVPSRGLTPDRTGRHDLKLDMTDSKLLGGLEAGSLSTEDLLVNRAETLNCLMTASYPSKCSPPFMLEHKKERQRPKTWPVMNTRDGDHGDDAPHVEGVKRCLQIDLRGDHRCGFDKSGLILRISDSLHAGGMRMLYASTMYTANVLVDSHESDKAEDILSTARL